MPDIIPSDAYLLIIGSMKCGTSSLFSYLNGHPEICRSREKEPEFFSKNGDQALKMEQYTDLWQFDEKVHKYAMEASTGYTKYPSNGDVPKRIFDSGINPRFIYIVRNPFDRIESHYNFMQSDASWGSDITDDHLIHASNYFLQLEQYRQYYPKDNILVLDFAELKENPKQLLKKTYQFLDISHSYFPPEFEAKNPTYMESPLEKKLKSSIMGKLFDYIPRPVKTVGKKLFRKDKRKLTGSEREYIHDKLENDIASFSLKYGFDVEQWGFKPS